MAASFEVNDPTLKQALLAHFVKQIETQPEAMEQLLMAGVSGELIDHLRYHATVSELGHVASFSRPSFTVHFDDNGLMACFNQLAKVLRDEQIKEYLAQHGASIDQLATWFSISKPEASSLREALGHVRTGGRPKLPAVAVRDAIHAAWAEIPPGRPEREAYHELHRQFAGFTVAALHQVVHEHDIASSAPRPVARRTPPAAGLPEPTKVRA